MADPQEQPKIIIDSDWKQQAQKEKERLAAQEKQAAEKAAAQGPGGAGPQGMPQGDFHAIVGTLASQALLYMGAFPDPETGRAIVSLEHAKLHIDMLTVLEAKTKGNLTKEESEDLTSALNALRLQFVEIAKAVEKATREGRIGRVPAGGGGGGVGGIPPGISGPSIGQPPA